MIPNSSCGKRSSARQRRRSARAGARSSGGRTHKVAAAALSADSLLEGDLDVRDVVLVEGALEERVAKAEDEQVLDHLLAKVVVNPEDLRGT
jgi:hypothetical protein